jgi:drug/metabolite transporter (DMT)-like permease
MLSARYRLGLVLVVTSSLAWSTAGLFTRILPLDGMTMLAWRGFYGALGMLALGLLLEGRQLATGLKIFVRRDGWPAWLFAACTVAGMICYITSLRATTVAHVAVIYASVPFVAAVLGWIFLAERPSISAIAASLAALVGIAVMAGFGSEGALAGDLLAFGMTLTMALSIVLTRRFRAIPFLPAAVLSALVSGIVCWPFGNPMSVSSSQMATLAAFGIVNSAVGFGLFTIGARFLPAIETALIGALDAPLSPLWVFLAFNEVPGPSTIVGGLIVFVSVAIYLVIGATSKPPLIAEIASLTPEPLP